MRFVIGRSLWVICKWMGCLLLPGFISSCSVSKQIGKQADAVLFKDTAIRTGHIGISIYEPATNKYWYNYDADKYFIPASNTKLFTLYAGMKYLGDSLVGLKYTLSGTPGEKFRIFAIQPTGDPTLLHPDFKRQPVMDLIVKYGKQYKNVSLLDTIWREERWGNGWAWNDYEDDYMAERNSFPIYGNVIDLKLNDVKERKLNDSLGEKRRPWISLFKTQSLFFDSVINDNIHVPWKINGHDISNFLEPKLRIKVKRNISDNFFSFDSSLTGFKNSSFPFVTNGNETVSWIISDSIKIKSFFTLFPNFRLDDSAFTIMSADGHPRTVFLKNWKPIHSQPSDSLFKPMMHRSDNFFAEQTLLMASNEKLGYMSDEKIIDTLLKTGLKDVPQKPRWVDGSGLSRYNLFTPQSFVYIINRTKNEFGWERLKNILPTGGEGTLSSYFKKDSGFIYAKTGTLSNNCALSGVLITKKGKMLIFSVLANNYITGATPVRKAVEKFLLAIRENY
ncbi:MAG: D-alanyl-D-alanine carboxypeptidase [Ferruginibacter sp.]|nr:D-alanyl-D-alanine carboxypeptidase [Ferruginibacter sp.]